MRAITCFSFLIFCYLFVTAQEVVDENIRTKAIPGTAGYQLRHKDERFEGLYRRDVAGEVIEVVSFVYGTIDYELHEAEAVVIKAPKIKEFKEIGVAGSSFGLNKNYHLNMLLKSNGFKTVPTKEVINGSYIYPQNLGVYGYIGKTTNPAFYLPVNVTSTRLKSVTKSQVPQLIMISNLELAEIRWSSSVQTNGQCTGFEVPKPYQLKTPFLQKGKPIILDLDKLSPGKQYCIKLETRTSADAKWVSKEFQIFIPATN